MKPSQENWKVASKIVNLFTNRDAYTCDHCERQYDDSICDKCLAVRLRTEIAEALQAKEAIQTQEPK